MAAAPGRERADLVIAGGVIATMDERRRLIGDGALAIKDGRILAVGKAAEIEPRFAATERIDAAGKLVLPGLIDGHNHPVHFLSKGMIDDMPFPARWQNRVWPYEAGLSAEETEVAATGTMIEMIRHGTTCFADPGTFRPEAVAAAAARVGIRAVVSRLTWDVHDPSAPAEYSDTTESALAKGEDLIARLGGSAGGRVRAWFSLVRGAHVTDALCRRVKERADALGVGIHAHLCTTPGEIAAARARWGMAPVERYRRLGVLGANAYLVHMGWIENGDVGLLKDADASVVHCPSASMFGGFGCIAHGKFPELVAAGVRVVLGTDAAAVSRFLDMVRVMYLAACAHKDAKIDPTVIGAHRALEMATVAAAKALLWDGPDGIGVLVPGKRADAIILDTDGIEWQPNPLANPIGNLVYGSTGQAVRTVVIDGRVVLRDRCLTTLDEAAYLARARTVSAAVLGRIGAPLAPSWPFN
jgi:cytosine/adenosine deaminase-related metal-dependent hydrolase